VTRAQFLLDSESRLRSSAARGRRSAARGPPVIARLVEWCGRNRALVLAAALLGAIAGAWALERTPLDALPDLSDTQVIVFTEWMGRSPTLVEDQVTYPITTVFLGAPKVSAVRGFTMFGMSFVYVMLFEDGTDIYWARSRALEYLSKLQGSLPPGVTPQIGPDATGVGWVFEYALVDRSGRNDLSELRSFQDWTLRYALAAVPGVAEVASLGGYQKQYQVTIDPTRLLAYRVSLRQVIDAIRMSNLDVGGRVIELSEHEYAVRGRGYVTGIADLERVWSARTALAPRAPLGRRERRDRRQHPPGPAGSTARRGRRRHRRCASARTRCA
jgi:Cu(I)/Ag(I) efflux system membrane protein CusA/SilA